MLLYDCAKLSWESLKAAIHLCFVTSDILQPCFSCVVFEQSGTIFFGTIRPSHIANK